MNDTPNTQTSTSSLQAAMTRATQEDVRESAAAKQRAFDNRIRAIATNAVLASMQCYGRSIITDDDAGRIDAIERLLILPTNKVQGFIPLVPTDQTSDPSRTAALQAAVDGAVGEN